MSTIMGPVLGWICESDIGNENVLYNSVSKCQLN